MRRALAVAAALMGCAPAPASAPARVEAPDPWERLTPDDWRLTHLYRYRDSETGVVCYHVSSGALSCVR